MKGTFFLQISPIEVGYYIHLGILILIMIVTGILGGYAGYLIEKNRLFQTEASDADSEVKKEKRYFLITGVCAALLIPLFLSTISSHLMTDAQRDPLQYFVFGGFCLLVAIFSKQFISSLSDKIIRKVQDEVKSQTEKTVTKALGEGGIVQQQVAEQVTKQTDKLTTGFSVMADLTNLEKQVQNVSNPKQLTLKDATDILDNAIESNNKDTITQVYDRLNILYFNAKQYDLMETIKDNYKDKLQIPTTSWANLAIANMNNYSKTIDVKYKIKAEDEIDEALKLLPDYGVPYALRLYLLLIDYHNLPKDDALINPIKDKIKIILSQIIASPKVTINEAYNYIMLNTDNDFSIYNDDLKALFPEEWKKIESLNKQNAT